ncbi:MAG: selenide, water dikinase SelD [Gammaproteobacteria bacterium]
MEAKRKLRLTETAKTGGCGCKIAPRRLRELLLRSGVLHSHSGSAPESLLAGAENAEDAAAWKISDDCAIVATADFFAPMVDVPRDFGYVAAANAISDVYAMGASPLFALALAAMPSAVLDDDDIAEIFSGGGECCRAAGIVVAGGHSIDAAEPLYGLAVIGRAHPEKILANGGAQTGDVLILGKPLGVGLMSAAHRNGRLSESDYRRMVGAMTTLNRAGEKMPAVDGVHSMTDVTGFGLLGHLLEMCRASSSRAVLRFSAVEFFARAAELAQNGEATGASKRNWESYGANVGGEIAPWRRTLLTDPQTGGGLLIACAPAAAAEVLSVLREHGNTKAAVVGEITPGADIFVEE